MSTIVFKYQDKRGPYITFAKAINGKLLSEEEKEERFPDALQLGITDEVNLDSIEPVKDYPITLQDGRKILNNQGDMD